jgi:hypothetical protein
VDGVTDTEAKALALVREVLTERNLSDKRAVRREVSPYTEALCRAIEAHEAFRQKVSDIVEAYVNATNVDDWVNLKSLIITKPDPLVEVIAECDDGTWETKAEYADKFRAALEVRGLEIREKGQ